MTRAMVNSTWIWVPSTCPVSTEEREMAMVRNRAMMPVVMSIATEIAVACTTQAMDSTMTPGTT